MARCRLVLDEDLYRHRYWLYIVDRGSGAPPRSPMGSYTYQRFRYRTPDELAGGRPIRRPVAIVGAGPAGLSAAIDLAQQGVPCMVGCDLKAIYRDVSERLRPKYGHWVIFDHCLPFDVSRAYDEATRFRDPRIWTAERDRQLWSDLES